MLRYLTAGESHGQGLVGVLEGMPAGLEVGEEEIADHLRRRQWGYGRGGRMKIESDRATILSGVRGGRTLGTPISLMIENRDWANWQDRMAVAPGDTGPPVTMPRPGHADLAGALKYGHEDIRNVLERASARETAMRVGLGSIARRLLGEFGMEILSCVVAIGSARLGAQDLRLEEMSNEAVDRSPVRCPDPEVERAMIEEIDRIRSAGDSIGGTFVVMATDVPPGLGSYVHWDRRLDGRLAQAMMSIPAIKAVEIGLGVEVGERPGSEVHDEIFWEGGGYRRGSNNAGGPEGGVTNGEPVVIRATMKPIPTLRKPLRSVDMRTKAPMDAHFERSDACAVPAASVVGEAMTALVLADAFLEKFGGDSVEEIRERFE